MIPPRVFNSNSLSTLDERPYVDSWQLTLFIISQKTWWWKQRTVSSREESIGWMESQGICEVLVICLTLYDVPIQWHTSANRAQKEKGIFVIVFCNHGPCQLPTQTSLNWCFILWYELGLYYEVITDPLLLIVGHERMRWCINTR